MNAFTDPEARALLTRVMNRMLEAGWLKRHVYTDGKGFHLVWTLPGSERALLLKRIVSTHGLRNDDRSPVAFTELSHGVRLTNLAVQPDQNILLFWKESTDLLQLRGDPDGLLALVQIVTTWAPDCDAPIRPE